MTDPLPGKDRTITRALAQLTKEMGEGAFRVFDDWEGSAYAVGVASPSHKGLLAYISTFDKPDGYYFLSLESPPPPGGERSYAPAGEFEHVSLGRLVRLVKRHLREGPGRGATESAAAEPGLKTDR